MDDESAKIGLEVHQQLNTNKLFCNCPSVLRTDDPKFEIERRLHAVAGEGGEVDIAAEYESKKDRGFVYQSYDTTCLVELDEEPPHLINQEALKIGLEIALLLNCEILPITQIMRKTVIDGSNTSGFQRTVLIARNGYVDTAGGRVRIDNVSLEEDAARIIKREDSKTFFRLDRLGIPLVEIGTAPDIKNAEQCKETALYIGDVLRSCNVKRGIGTIRQDINISVERHPRVEIKGFQEAKMFIPVIKNEIRRQKNSIQSEKFEREVRNALPSGETEFLRPMPGPARMYPETDLPLLKITRRFISDIKTSLPKLRTEIKSSLVKKGLKEDEIKILLKVNKLEEFESLIKLVNEPRFIFKVLIEIPREMEKKFGNKTSEILTTDFIESIVDKIFRGELEKSDVKHIMEEASKGKKLENIRIDRADLSEVENEIVKIVNEKPGLSAGAYMGLIMQKFKGKVSGREVREILSKLLKSEKPFSFTTP